MVIINWYINIEVEHGQNYENISRQIKIDDDLVNRERNRGRQYYGDDDDDDDDVENNNDDDDGDDEQRKTNL